MDEAERKIAIAEARKGHADAAYVPVNLDASLRIAHAMEYIAAQLHSISAKLDHLIAKE